VYARIAGEHPRLYPALGIEWRKAGGKIRVSVSSTNQSDEDYLTKLVAAMIAEDTIGYGVNESMSTSSTQDFIRILPSISEDFTNPKVKVYKHEFAQHIAELTTPVDDPMYIELHAKYYGAILYDNETRARQKLFRIAGIQFVRSFAKNRPSCWEATCEPVFRDAATGTYVVPQEHKVEGSNVLLATALQGYALTEYPEGLEQPGVHLPWVDHYLAYFKNVVEPTFTEKIDSPLDAPSTPLQPTRTRRSRQLKR
jgi:hypothetical protein